MKQQCILALLLAFSTLATDSRAQATVAGYWLGVTYPSDPNQAVYNYTMTLTQAGTTVGGTAQTANPNVPFGGVAYISGILGGSTVSFVESDKNGSSAVKDICFWKGVIVFNSTDESLIGNYANIVNGTTCTDAGGGTIELYRIALKSPSTFCKDGPMDLRVTGKNLRWYSSDKKTTLLASGNTYSPKLTKTTTFYVTQTLYQNESPVVPITINVLESSLTVSTLNTGCDKNNGSLAVAATGSSGFQYSLNNGPFQKNALFTSLKPGSYTVVARDTLGCKTEQAITITSDTAPTITSLVSTPPKCATANGTISVVAAGGKGPLTYSIDYGVTYQTSSLFTNLAGGSYTLRARDANACEVNRAVTLPVFKPMVILSSAVTPTTCGQANGQATLTIAGGTNPVQYSSDNQLYQASGVFTRLKSGNYSLTARDSAGCTVTQSVSVAASTGPQPVSIQTTAEGCGLKNGIVSFSTNQQAGSNEYALDGQSFQRKTAFTGLEAGIYTLTIRDASSCTLSQTVTIPLDCPNVVHLPTAFSPNRDTSNDGFTARFAFPSLSVTQFTVFDRWGAILYSRSNFTLTSGEPLWDGQLNGQPAQPGAYVYRLDCQFPDGTQSSYRESVALLN
ncbi:gliding motility-associated C-terminal domain-containing protein [Spirosoma luteum]|uniref:T9SS type B sorting domain-containing protein n=1 Tax=Spirosoma luteum TaxID=431553 RepID=UPI000372A4E8|nr:gliding motility-associated C-terminal domain-containing protein [Spirosoma luteum]